MRTNLGSYDVNILFSWINNTSLPDIDLSQYKSIKNGTYHKALKQYYKTYNSDGSAKILGKGLVIDVVA